MRPIPARLLIHSATLMHSTAVDVWQSPTFTETELTRVRIDPTSRIVHTKDNTEVTLAAVLYYDCVNSRPAGISFEPGDMLSFGGSEYTVQSCELLYDSGRLHHMEVGLI